MHRKHCVHPTNTLEANRGSSRSSGLDANGRNRRSVRCACHRTRRETSMISSAREDQNRYAPTRAVSVRDWAQGKCRRQLADAGAKVVQIFRGQCRCRLKTNQSLKHPEKLSSQCQTRNVRGRLRCTCACHRSSRTARGGPCSW